MTVEASDNVSCLYDFYPSGYRCVSKIKLCVLQPLHSEMSPAPTLLDLQSSGAADSLIESMGNPVEELREAVEMLNDTARERGRSQNHEQAIRELLSKV